MIISQSIINGHKEIDTFYLSEKISTDSSLYKLDSHKGVIIEEGKIHEKGCKFYTKEKFFIFFIQLNFVTLTFDYEQGFTFLLTKPFEKAHIVGKFSLSKDSDGNQILSLTVNYDKTDSIIGKIQQFIIFKTFIRTFVQKQIDKETQMIVGLIK